MENSRKIKTKQGYLFNGGSPNAYRLYQKNSKKNIDKNDEIEENQLLPLKVFIQRKHEAQKPKQTNYYSEINSDEEWVETNNANTNQKRCTLARPVANIRDEDSHEAIEPKVVDNIFNESQRYETNEIDNKKEVEEIFNILTLLDKTLNKENTKASVRIYDTNENIQSKYTPRGRVTTERINKKTPRTESEDKKFSCDGIRVVHFKRKNNLRTDETSSEGSIDPDMIDEECLRRNHIDYVI